MSRLGIATPNIPHVFSVCKTVDIRPKSVSFLSTYALIFSEVARTLTILEIEMERKTVKKVKGTFCGVGPSNFQEVLDYSQSLMDTTKGEVLLTCREELKNLIEVLDFITAHLWVADVEAPEVMGATEDAGEIVLRCFTRRT